MSFIKKEEFETEWVSGDLLRGKNFKITDKTNGNYINGVVYWNNDSSLIIYEAIKSLIRKR